MTYAGPWLPPPHVVVPGTKNNPVGALKSLPPGYGHETAALRRSYAAEWTYAETWLDLLVAVGPRAGLQPKHPWLNG